MSRALPQADAVPLISKSSPRPIGIFFAVLAGSLMTVQIPLGGNLFATEVVLLGYALLGLHSWLGSPGQQSILVLRAAGLACLMLISYTLSDLLTQNTWDNQLRGLARCFFLVSDTLGLWHLVRRDRRLISTLLVSLAVAQIAQTLLTEEHKMFVAEWKFGYALPVTILVLVILPALESRAQPRLTMAGLLAASVLHVYLDYRSLSGVCLVVWSIMVYRSLRSAARTTARPVLAGVLTAAALGLASTAYFASREDFSTRREAANAARLAGISAALDAITSSPVLGHGSWAYDGTFGLSFDDEYTRITGKRYVDVAGYQEFGAHSQLLQGWYEGGALAGLFFGFLLIQLLRLLFFAATNAPDSAHLPLFVLIMTLAVWHLLFSPFAGEHRFWLATATILMGLMQDSKATVERRRLFQRWAAFARREGGFSA
ncbi:MAG: O-antigen ligase family protein [Bryobacteraceae bacterium]